MIVAQNLSVKRRRSKLILKVIEMVINLMNTAWAEKKREEEWMKNKLKYEKDKCADAFAKCKMIYC